MPLGDYRGYSFVVTRIVETELRAANVFSRWTKQRRRLRRRGRSGLASARARSASCVVSQTHATHPQRTESSGRMDRKGSGVHYTNRQGQSYQCGLSQLSGQPTGQLLFL